MTSDPSPKSYREAYATLERLAAELEAGEADLDRVLPLLEQAREAYAVCQARIAAVREVLSSDWSAEASEDDPQNTAE